MKLTAAFPQLEAFHRMNATPVRYRPPFVGEVSRGGVATPGSQPANVSVGALIEWEPTVEEVTVFGDPSSFGSSRKAVFRILASDLTPVKQGSFEYGSIDYQILGINMLERGGQVYCWDCLVGYV